MLAVAEARITMAQVEMPLAGVAVGGLAEKIKLAIQQVLSIAAAAVVGQALVMLLVLLAVRAS